MLLHFKCTIVCVSQNVLFVKFVQFIQKNKPHNIPTKQNMRAASLRVPFSPLCVAFSPHAQDDDNQPLAAGQESGEIALYTQAALRKGESCSHKLKGHQRNVSSVAFSSGKEQLLASGSSDKTVRLWDMRTKECVAELLGHKSGVTSLAFSPNNRLLASTSVDRTVRLWDVVERKAASPVHVLHGHTNRVWSVSFSPDGQQLASGSWDRTVRLWSVPEGVPGPVLQHPQSVCCVAFSPAVGSNMLASGCDDGIVRLWDVSGTKQQQPLRELHEHSSWITSVAFSPDGSQLVSGSCDNTVRLWSMASGKLLKTLTGHLGTLNSVAFHPNGKQVASGSNDKTVRLWTVCEWSDRTHQLFGPEMKQLVFCLMCIKEEIEKNVNQIVPQLPIALWLDICLFLCI
jgi:WD40 repeat protein